MNLSGKVKMTIARFVATLCILIFIGVISFMVYTVPFLGWLFGMVFLIGALIQSLHYIESNKEE